MILHHSNLKVSEVSHMNGAMQVYPGEADMQEYMRYSAENATQACPATDVCWSTAMMEPNDDEMDMQMNMQEYRSALAQYMRHSPENATHECHAPDVCDRPRNDNEKPAQETCFSMALQIYPDRELRQKLVYGYLDRLRLPAR